MQILNMTCYVFILVPLRGEINSGPRPQNKILVPFRGHFQKIRQAPPSLLCGSPPPGIYAAHLLVQVDKLDILPGQTNKQTNKQTPFAALEDFAEFRKIMYDIFH